MKKILFLIFLLISIAGFGQITYYVKEGGNDLADGQSIANAWASLTKVNGTNFNPGDSILFNRGDKWTGQISPRGGTAESGTKDAPIVFAAYGTGAKPIIDLSDTLYGWSGAGNWRLQAENVYALYFQPSVSRFIVDGNEVRKAGSIAGVNGTANYYIKPSVDSVYFYATGNPATTYTSMIATYPNETYSSPFYLYNDNWIYAYGLDLRGGYYSAYTTRGIGAQWDSCRIGYYSAYFGLSIGGAVGDSARYVTVKNCEIDANCKFYETADLPYTEDGLSINGQTFVVTIEKNTFKNWGHSVIYLKNLTSTYYNDSIIIRDNDISCPDLGDGRGFNFDTYGTNSTNVYVYRNYVHNTPVMSQLNCNGMYFYYNIIDSVVGCPFESGVGSGLNISGYNTNTAPQNMKIWNNVIGNCDDYGILFTHYTGRPHKYNNEFKNNIIYNCASEALRIYNNATDTGLYNNIFKNNLFYDSGTEDVVEYWGVAMTVDEFEDENGNEGDDIDNNLFGNPDFTSTTDFSLLSTSPAINAGIDVGLTVDYALTRVPQGTYFDIGAYEFVNFPIATTGLGWEDILSHRNFKGNVNIAGRFSVDGVPIVFSGGAPVNIPGLTASASELNILDGATVTTAEVNYSDGVTSNIQTQITGKADTSLSNLASVAINTHLLPGTDGAVNLGSATYKWGNIFLDSAKVINFNNGDITATHSDNALTFAGGNIVLPSTTSIGDVSSTEIGYVNGVTSAIQTQLNALETRADSIVTVLADSANIETLLQIDLDTDTVATKAYARTYGGSGSVTIGDVRDEIADSLNALRPIAAATVTGYTPAGGSLTLSGADAITLTTTAATGVTLPTTGTLATTTQVALKADLTAVKLNVDTVGIFVFGAGSGAAADSTLFEINDSNFGSFHNYTDTLYVVNFNVLYLTSGDSLRFNCYYGNRMTGVATDSLFNAIQAVGTDQNILTPNDRKIPPNTDVWIKMSGTQLTGLRPKQFEIQLNGYIIRDH